MPITVAELEAGLILHDKGLLKHGAHQQGDREYCALEFDSVMRGREFSDAPLTLPDLRSLNDAQWPNDQTRTTALLPVMAALWDWTTWTSVRKQVWASKIAIETVRQIVAELPTLSLDIALQCKNANSLEEAAGAARAATWAAEAAKAAARAAAWAAEAAKAAAWAAEAAKAAARAATWAAEAAAWAAASAHPLHQLCAIFIQAAEETCEL